MSKNVLLWVKQYHKLSPVGMTKQLDSLHQWSELNCSRLDKQYGYIMVWTGLIRIKMEWHHQFALGNHLEIELLPLMFAWNLVLEMQASCVYIFFYSWSISIWMSFHWSNLFAFGWWHELLRSNFHSIGQICSLLVVSTLHIVDAIDLLLVNNPVLIDQIFGLTCVCQDARYPNPAMGNVFP